MDSSSKIHKDTTKNTSGELQASSNHVSTIWPFWQLIVACHLTLWLQSEGLYIHDRLSGPILDDNQLASCCQHLSDVIGTDISTKTGTVKQKAVELVTVPLGWLHQVVTVVPCLKMAWDHVRIFSPMRMLASVHNIDASFLQYLRWLLCQLAGISM